LGTVAHSSRVAGAMRATEFLDKAAAVQPLLTAKPTECRFRFLRRPSSIQSLTIFLHSPDNWCASPAHGGTHYSPAPRPKGVATRTQLAAQPSLKGDPQWKIKTRLLRHERAVARLSGKDWWQPD